MITPASSGWIFPDLSSVLLRPTAISVNRVLPTRQPTLTTRLRRPSCSPPLPLFTPLPADTASFSHTPPPTTLPACRHADIHVTSDHHLVLFHDPSLGSTTTGDGKIKELPWVGCIE
jgi:hypothetical protein